MSTHDTADAHPRFADALRELGLTVPVRRFPEATRTAQQAADAIGCDVAEIVKSLVFEVRGAGAGAKGPGEPVVVLVDGSSRVDVERVRGELGAASVERASAGTVRAATGYAIGGVPPFGHLTPSRVLADRGLLDHAVVWAAAGTPHTVFPLDPKTLIAHAGATVVDVRERTA
ncbi:YbaK/EbsC family protein [Streptomyces sp. t39]|uniref:YbaK/EbsC family protein n=1 Tax=Streptomyces sp. t39 TaxID=1828156 RepID=UPI0011CE3CDD|nr:YbaK/EbsC family protein [Streptomyces sp. t39]TXS55567.1 YbaK/EbsC family protein [Streptomyces sp. t39]